MGATMNSKILVVDDEKHIVELARLYLTREGYEVEGVGDGAQAVARFGQVKPDLVILDIMLPGTDGLTICKEIRKQSQVPIIMLTARDEVTDKVVGLEVGADDYLTKPFHPQELVARAKALLRRARTEPDQPKLVRAGKLEVDIERHEVRLAAAAGIVAISLVLAGALTWVFVRDLEFQSVQDQLDREAITAQALVRHQECANPIGAVTNPGAAACRQAAVATFEDRLRAIVPGVNGNRVLLLDRQRRVVFDSESDQTLGTVIVVNASKRVAN